MSSLTTTVTSLLDFVTNFPRILYILVACVPFLKIMRILPVIILVLCAAGSRPVPASPSALPGQAAPCGLATTKMSLANNITAIRAAEVQRAQAVSQRDVDALRQLISGEYYHVETNGRTRSKTEFLQMLARDEYEFRSYDTEDVRIKLLEDGRSAVVTGRLHVQMQGTNRPREWRGRYVRVWVRDGDSWRNTLHQSTEIRSNVQPTDAHASLLK